MKKYISIFTIALLSLSPQSIYAAGIVPDCGRVVNGVIPTPCDFTYLILLINKIIKFLLFDLATPLAALVIVYAGWLYLSSGGGEQTSKAKTILKNVIIGYVIALAAWLIVNTIVRTLGFTGETFLTK